jgi:hypothetical protein
MSSDESNQSAMNSRCSSPEFISGFVNVCIEHICLWKVKDKCHSDKDMREKACEKLLDDYKQLIHSTKIRPVEDALIHVNRRRD